MQVSSLCYSPWEKPAVSPSAALLTAWAAASQQALQACTTARAAPLEAAGVVSGLVTAVKMAGAALSGLSQMACFKACGQSRMK